jgi:hypothetical protein
VRRSWYSRAQAKRERTGGQCIAAIAVVRGCGTPARIKVRIELRDNGLPQPLLYRALALGLRA